MIRLIVGLGNPGKRYQKTRHNIGAWCVTNLCQYYQAVLYQKPALHGLLAQLPLSEMVNVHVCIPTTFINQSGFAVGAVARYYKVSPEEILIIHDELDFPSGIARFKFGGGHGGHNGLKSIPISLKNNDFWRLRIGIGHPGNKLAVPDYVLSTPTAIEYNQIQTLIQKNVTVLKDFCLERTECAIQAMHAYK